MVKPHNFLILMALLPFLLLFSIATVGGRPTTVRHRSLPPNCDPVFGICSDQWPFLRRQIPPVVLPPPADHSDPSFSPLVASPPPPRYAVPNPPPSDSDPSFSPLVASPPPPRRPRDTLPPIVPEMPPSDDDTNTAPPLMGLSFSPPEVSIPPPVQDSMQPEPFYVVPAPPLIPVVSRPQEITMPPPVDESATTEPRLPPVAQSPPAA